MKAVTKRALKANLSACLREVEETGEDLVVLYGTKPVLRITPYKAKKLFDDVFKPFQNQMTYTEPLESGTEDEWGNLA